MPVDSVAMDGYAIYVRGLKKAYNGFDAVKGIDFDVRVGEVFGLLGPNGAGKTTTLEILEGLRPRTAGEVKVLDFDPDRQKKVLKDRIGVCLQATNLPDKLRVGEALEFFGARKDGEGALAGHHRDAGGNAAHGQARHSNISHTC